MDYKFRAATEKDAFDLFGMSKICDIYDFMTYISEMNKKTPLAFGQLKARFGEPVYISDNLESQYEYHIIAEDENGTEYRFLTYSGPTGPSVSGKSRSKGALEAAEALAEFVRNAEAMDYTYEGYYMDGLCKIKMGVKDGTPYFEEEDLNLSETEFKELYNRLYGLEDC